LFSINTLAWSNPPPPTAGKVKRRFDPQTKNGVPEAILLSMNKFEGLMETLEILSDEKAMTSIRKSIEEARKGKWLDYDEVFAE
jgi:PHD/YefM family antitoxin component YafN of YafNO toxin-antitoxin module